MGDEKPPKVCNKSENWGYNSKIRNTVNSRLADTPLLRTDGKSPAETTMKCIEITLAITEFRTLRAVPN